jgi:hypothetical protein
MEHLTKQQIVLLTLLVSFMTSLSTGIVTVSLMDQAPAGVTRTINQVIEKTIQQSAPSQTASVGTVNISVEDQIASATALVSTSTVKIVNSVTGNVVGLGLIVSKSGLVMTDKSLIDQNQLYSIVLANGAIVPVSISTLSYSQNFVQGSPQNQGQNIAQYANGIFLIPTTNLSNGLPIVFTPINTTSSINLGQKVFSLSGTSSLVFSDGLVSQISSSSISSTILPGNSTIGSPVFDIQGNVIGIAGQQSSSSQTIFQKVAN